MSGYSSSVRNVPTSEKDQVYAEYGIVHRTTGEFEVDHLISLELGGSNDISNLWPEAASPKPGFHEKDKVENYLHDQVCRGAISLQAAQQEIATNWLACLSANGRKLTKMTDQPEIPVETLAETDSYSVWRSQEPDNEDSYHIEFGSVTVHFFDEEWQEFMQLMHDLPADVTGTSTPKKKK